MKTSITLLILLGAWIGVIAQAPEAISYQAVARDNSGNLLTNQLVSFRLSILYGTPGGPAVYSESHTTTTNDFGLATLQVGNGTVISGVFSDIDWGLGYYYLKTEMDPAGGTTYQLMGTSQFLSVPYALYAKTAGSGGSSLPPGISGQTLRHDGSSWVANSLLFNTGSNIGIGTTAPAHTLEVSADVAVNGLRIGKGPGTTSRNTVLGEMVLASNINSFDNTAVGYTALSMNQEGYMNTAIGSFASQLNTSGIGNTAVGTYALNSNETGSNNAAFGQNALKDNTASSNCAFGSAALMNNTTGSCNTAMGSSALVTSTTANANSAFGYLSLSLTSTGGDNTAIGFLSLRYNSTGTNNTAAGSQSLYANTTGIENSALGAQSLVNNSTGISNTAVGYSTLFASTTGNNNTVFGYKSMYSNVGNSRSTAVGYQALRYADNRSTGRETYNTAIGYEALRGSSTPANNTGQYNTVVGDQALFNTTSGYNNTGTGYQTLYSNTTGYQNSTVGYQTGRSITTGYSNTILGYQAGYNGIALTTGDNNVLIGALVDAGIGTRSNSIGIGSGVVVNANNQVRLGNSSITSMYCQGAYQATTTSTPNMYVSSTGQIMRSTASVPTGTGVAGKVAFWDGVSSLNYNDLLHWDNTNGRLGIGVTNPAFDLVVSGDVTFNGVRIGNGNNNDLLSTACGELALSSTISGGINNSAFGYKALRQATTGYGNTAVGYYSLESHTTGIYNTAVGTNSLKDNTTGNYNVATGTSALAFNVDGDYNVAIGNQSLLNNVGNSGSTAIGHQAMYYADSRVTGRTTYNTAVGRLALRGSTTPLENTGLYNTAIGDGTLYSNTSGNSNTAVGSSTLQLNLSGNYNTACGKSAMVNNTTGDNNTVVGASGLNNATSGYSNVAVGYYAGDAVITGYRNTIIGSNADVDVGTMSNSTAIGYLSIADASNQIRLGNASITTFYCHGAYNGVVGTTNRDLFADNLGKIGYVSSSKRYKENITFIDDIGWLYQLQPVNFNYKTDESKTKQFGLIAEEVEKVIPQLVSYNEDGLPETVSYSSLITPMLKAIQEDRILIMEQQRKIEKMEQEIQELRGQR